MKIKKELKKTKFWHKNQSNIQTKNIGNNCVIHSHTWIGEDVKIGNNVKIQAFAFIPSGVVLENNVFIGPHVCFVNDKKPKATVDDYKLEKTLVKKGASIGANATILCGLTIGEDALIGAGSVVTHNVPDKEIWVGNPATLVTVK